MKLYLGGCAEEKSCSNSKQTYWSNQQEAWVYYLDNSFILLNTMCCWCILNALKMFVCSCCCCCRRLACWLKSPRRRISTLWTINKPANEPHMTALQPNEKTSLKWKQFSPRAACHNDITTLWPQNYGRDFQRPWLVCVVFSSWDVTAVVTVLHHFDRISCQDTVF